MKLKSFIVLTGVVFGAISANAQLDMNEIKDGQVLAVTGFKNMMPGPPMIHPSAMVDSVTVKFAVISGGCTEAEHFAVQLKKVSKNLYMATADRKKIDACEGVVHVEILEKKIEVPAQTFKHLASGGAKVVTEPYTSVGVAY